MATYFIYKGMMEQSTQTTNINERPKGKKVDQRALLYTLKKKLKREQGREPD